MEDNILRKDVRIHHRICDTQKHLVQRTGHLIEESINREKSI